MEENEVPNILDCTLRDGGYQNNWQFSLDAIERYLGSLDSVGVDFIEVGLRTPFQPNIFRGVAAYSPDRYLHQVRQFTEKPIGVLLNSKDWPLLTHDDRPSVDWNSLSQAVDFVRVATTFDDIDVALIQVEEAKLHGLSVFLNVMQAHNLSDSQRESVLSSVAKSPGLSALYLADTFGAMAPSEVHDMISFMAGKCRVPIGFHAHDNRGLALANAQAATLAGAQFLDGTFAGMGRGAGNARTEQLLIEFDHLACSKVEFFDFVNDGKSLVQSDWPVSGLDESCLYSIGAKSGIHPTYVQQIIESGELSATESGSAIKELSLARSSAFTERLLEVGWLWFSEPLDGEVKIDEVGFEGRTVLLIGSGDSVRQFAHEIGAFAEQNEVFPAYVGTNSTLEKNQVVKHRFVSNPFSLLSSIRDLDKLGESLIGPWTQIPEHYTRLIPSEQKINLPIKLEVESVGIDGTGALILPNSRSSALAIAATVLMGADRVVLAGFDGYGGSDYRNSEFTRVLRGSLKHREIEVTSLTPTMFPIPYERTV